MSAVEPARDHRQRVTARPVRTLVRSCGATLLAVLTAVDALPAQESWLVDSAEVAFEIRNAGLPVRGAFDRVDARVCFDPSRPGAGALSGTMHPKSVRTGIALRDRHLQRRGWFDVARYGEVAMSSVRLWQRDGGFAGSFLLRIRDVEREVEVLFTFEREGRRAHVRGATTIDRLDFGLGEASFVLSDSVAIEVELTLVPDERHSGRSCR
jgi:polyisoprenoid-binding protein YceI